MEEAMDIKALEKTAAEVRVGVVKAIHNAGSGHPGGSLSAADIVTALYFSEMNVDPKNPKMEGRDKFILSKGHAGPVQYSALALKGYFPVEDFMTLRKLGSKFQGHPDMNKVPGIEMSTGSLGQGFAAAGGMAIANKLNGMIREGYTCCSETARSRKASCGRQLCLRHTTSSTIWWAFWTTTDSRSTEGTRTS